MKDKGFRNTVWFTILIILTSIYDVMFRAGVKIPRLILILGTIWGAYILYKKTFINRSIVIYNTILAFIFFAMYMGNVWDFYGVIPKYDKILHLVSGIIIALIGYALFLSLCGDKNSSIHPLTGVVFSIIFSIAIAGVWEIHEFTTDQIFGLMSQNNSLHDTMWDIICGTIMGLITNIPIYMYSKGKKVKIVEVIAKEYKQNS